MVGVLLGLLVAGWVRTLRLTVEAAEGSQTRGRVLAFLHGQQMALLAGRGAAAAVVLVSHSLDGEIQARVMTHLGFSVVRGSSSRGGARALAELVRRLRRGVDAALAIDGPRGPLGVIHPGAAFAAYRSGAVLVPVASAARRAWVLHEAWDRFEIPWPFSRVAIVLGAPLSARAAIDEPACLARALGCARSRAVELAMVGPPRARART